MSKMFLLDQLRRELMKKNKPPEVNTGTQFMLIPVNLLSSLKVQKPECTLDY
jgi:hypothetical protein